MKSFTGLRIVPVALEISSRLPTAPLHCQPAAGGLVASEGKRDSGGRVVAGKSISQPASAADRERPDGTARLRQLEGEIGSARSRSASRGEAAERLDGRVSSQVLRRRR